MAHQPQIKRTHLQPCRYPSPKHKKPHQMCTHKKLAKQQNNVLKSQITKRYLRSHNKGLHPMQKNSNLFTLELVVAKLFTKLDYPN